MEETQLDTEVPKQRKANFTKEEDSILLEEYKIKKGILDAKLSSKVTSADKGNVWLEIRDKINASSSCKRTAEEIKQRLNNLKKTVKAKVSEQRRSVHKTGGGPANVSY